MLHELVEFVHVYVDKELRREIPERQPTRRRLVGLETADDFHDEGKDALVGDITTYDVVKNALIDGGEEFSDVAFEYPAGAGVVARNFVRELPEPIHRLVRALASAAGARVCNERAVEERGELAIQRMVEKPVTHCGFVDVAGLGVGYLERFVTAVLVCPLFQVAMECEDVVHQLVLELLHVCLFALPAYELTPCGEQVLHRDENRVAMNELKPHRVTPPPNGFCPCLSASSRCIFCGMSTILNYQKFTNTLSAQR